jgi:hypothetical protein
MRLVGRQNIGWFRYCHEVIHLVVIPGLYAIRHQYGHISWDIRHTKPLRFSKYSFVMDCPRHATIRT